MLYPAELRARGAILPKFAGIAAAPRGSARENANQRCGGDNAGVVRTVGFENVPRRDATENRRKAEKRLVGLGRLELPTSPLSVVADPLVTEYDQLLLP
jgi:hypothetical protein